MKIVIAGGTGFVGRALCETFSKAGHEIIVLTRNKRQQTHPNVAYVEWLHDKKVDVSRLSNVDAVINLAGESINARWTKKKKAEILNSRLKAAEAIYKLIQQLEKKPNVYIQASAIGFYGTSETETFTEQASKPGHDFLAHVASKWEEAGKVIENEGIRTVYMRFGLILSKDDGALPRIILPYKWFFGGKLGKGNQWASWVHIEDVCSMIRFAIENENINGPLNVTAPNPVTMNELGKTAAKILKRPHWLSVPAFALKLILGEMSTLVLDGQRVLPEKALENGFHFQFETLDEALENLFQQSF